jgi:hypothetical protein
LYGPVIEATGRLLPTAAAKPTLANPCVPESHRGGVVDDEEPAMVAPNLAAMVSVTLVPVTVTVTVVPVAANLLLSATAITPGAGDGDGDGGAGCRQPRRLPRLILGQSHATCR